MITEEVAKKQLQTLHLEGIALVEEFGAEYRRQRKLYPKPAPKDALNVVIVRFAGDKQKDDGKEQEPAPEPLPVDETHFEERYQSWYSRALPLMKQLAPDRYAEFQSFYVVDPRYPWHDRSAYVIQDFFRGRGADDPGGEATRCFKNQLAILRSVTDRLAWTSLDTDDQAERGMQLALLEAARDLIGIDERAAGAMAGTMLDAYLKKLADRRAVKFRKQKPPTAELVEALKQAKVFDVPVWSQATWLAEIHARCLKEGEGPTKLQVRDLVDGTQWLLTHVF
ncbi:MAG TPA: hypothetical protein VGV16_06270 [Gammaproteobacteria bacterium]|nr:hypothetical protein [Gammaproteobacteria bacterium]